MSEHTSPIKLSTDKDIRIVEFTVHKIIDETFISEIGQALASVIETTAAPKMLLDFSTVDHLSSAALGMLINANRKILDRNGKLRLCTIKPEIMEVFVITKLNKMFKILPTRAEAVASFSQT